MPGIDLNYMPDETRDIFLKLSKTTFIGNYTLVGGTALAVQIGHRLSEDLDFIYDGERLPVKSIIKNMARLFPDYRIVRQDYNDQIDMVVSNAKLTFFTNHAVMIPFKVMEHSFQYGKANIARTEIIASLKFAALAQRNTIRDYYDLYYISKHVLELKEIMGRTKELLPNLSPITYTETLVYTDDIPENDIANHLKPKENISKYEIADYFSEELRKIINQK